MMTVGRHAACVLLLLILGGTARAFDIAAYGDARFNINHVTERGCDCEGLGRDAARDTMIAHMRNENDLWRWLEEMGLTHLAVYYPRAEDFAALRARPVDKLKIMNVAYAWPIEGDYFILAQNRDLYPGRAWSETVSNRWLKDVPLAPTARKQARGVSPVLAIGPGVAGSTNTPGYIWGGNRHGVLEAGTWNGWQHTQRANYGIPDSLAQPVHIRITCDVDPAATGPDEVLTVYWLVRDGDGWIRYPGFTIRNRDFERRGGGLEEFETVIVPRNFTAERLDNDFRVQRALPNFTHAFGRGTPVAVQLYYHGAHSLYLHRVQIWDEGYHRMLMADPATRRTWVDRIGDAFEEEWRLAGGKSAGWYFDEWSSGGDDLEALVFLNKILRDRGLPAMFINGYGEGSGDILTGREDLFAEMARQGAEVPVHMNEFYMFGADYPGRWRGPVPRCAPGNVDTAPMPCAPRRGDGGLQLEFMPTDSSSDVPYLRIENQCGFRSYAGRRSLQCAIDTHLWDFRPVYRQYGLNPPPGLSIDEIPRTMCLVPQVEYVHARGSKLWALIAKDEDNPFDLEYCCPLDTPSVNEIKLSAWLAVAADCDGIMWYNIDVDRFVDWKNCRSDWCARPSDNLCTRRDSLVKGELFEPAKALHGNIHRVAAILDTLEFVRTYSSRAFRADYASSEAEWVRADELYRDGGRVCRVASIRTEEDSPDDTYVQVSRFMTRGTEGPTEDYWFLIVNRRALGRERRTVSLSIEGLGRPEADYTYRRHLGDRVDTARMGPAADARQIRVELDPGEAELVHFYRRTN